MNTLKTVLFTCLIVLLIFGCQQEPQVNQAELDNIALVKRVHAEIMKGNVDIMDEVLSENYIRHCQAMPPGLQELTDKDLFKSFLTEFITSCEGYQDEIGPIFAKDDMVAYVSIMTGVQSGPLGDLPASNKEFNLTNIIIHRFENGKIAETWVSWDNVAMLSQLGFFPPPQG